MMVWRPFMRQWAQSAKRVRFLGLAFDSGWQEPLNGFAPNSNGRRAWSFARMKLDVKVKAKGQGHQRQKTRCALTTPPRYGQNGTPSSQITSRKQQTRRFDRCRRVSSPGCVRWAWLATAGLRYAFLVLKGGSVA